MRLEGSCHCGAVRFSLESAHVYPFNLCYCSICRKTAGAGGYAINIGGWHETLEVCGRDAISVYQAMMVDPATGEAAPGPTERHFCSKCGSALWVWDPRWPRLVHPFSSAIDTPLPVPPERTHMMLGSKAGWVEPVIGPKDQTFAAYPTQSLAQWHERLGLSG